MKNLKKVASELEHELDEVDMLREEALRTSRSVVRLAGELIRGLHKGMTPHDGLKHLRTEVSRLQSLVSKHHSLENAGYVESALQEYAEACIVSSLVQKADVPSPEQIGVESVPFLLGLGDSVGELRRLCLAELKAGKVVEADRYLEMMEDIYSALMRFEYPDAVLPIRHKQDVARSLLEKTRGEVAVATSAKNLHAKIEEALKKR